ncbi:ABC transporter ATP-binding protein/permease [Clostridium tagluense]|nr:ABC transporter ATP-binding protein [Clostridium tagluense]MCB2366186.1 ABC transporter ATP-binding protein/permease [Clostridium tagluense]WAG53440.1 ABC transporter ATP-binding protein/permease [Clostridium tagluense]
MKKFSEVLSVNVEILKISRVKSFSYFIVTLCIVFIAGSNFIYSFMLQTGIDAVNEMDMKKFTIATIIFIVASMMYGVAYYYGEKNKEIVSQEIAIQLKSMLLKKVNTIHFEKSSKYKKGDLFTLIHVDADNCARYVTDVIFPFIQVMLSLIIGIFYVAYFSWQMFLVAMLGIPFFLYINIVLMKKIRGSFTSVKVAEGDERDFFTDLHNSSSTMKIFSINYVMEILFKRVYHNKTRSRVIHERNSSKVYAYTESGILGIEFLVLLAGIPLVKIGQITVGTLIGTWNATIGTFIYPITDMPDIISKMAEKHSSWDRISSILNIPDEENNVVVKKLSNPELVIEELNFKYNSGDKQILTNVNFCIKKNQIAIIVGESGTGKSTLMKLILSLFNVTSGKIFIRENKNIIDKEIRKYISYIPQGNSLLNISIRNNITMGKKYSDEEIRNAVKMAQIGGFIDRLPHKYDTVISEDVEVSEGEAQRIAIARALLRNSDFILMDEPFSALDEENEKKIVNVINNLKQSKGIIIITHRKTNKINSDYIYELIGGELNER